jgi:hypothetical protein
MDKFHSFYTTLRWNFKNGIWHAATFNFGPHTVSFPHFDPGNLLYGWCSITSLGPFDPKRGGHIILWDLGLIVEFPPSSTIFVPSAIVTHSNTPIQPGEHCYSFTQYGAGGTFRFIANGLRSESDFLANANKEEKVQREMERQSRWERGLAMFLKLSEFTPAP